MRRPPIAYTSDQMEWLEENRMMVISDYHAAFVVRFGCTDVSAAHLHALRKRKGWKVGRDGGRYKGRRWRYTEAEVAFLRERETWDRPRLYEAFQSKFGHPDLSLAAFKSLCKREGCRTGRPSRFKPGHVPWTKGRKLPFNAASAETQFKKGQMPHNTRGAGYERIDKQDGYVILIVEEPNPWTGAATRPVHKHRYLWEKANGPVPEGMRLKCLDGNKQNTDPSNWEPVPVGMLPRLNGIYGRGYDDAPAELKPTIMATAKLEHKARELRRARRDGR